MSGITINNANLVYETLGQGSALVFTSGGFAGLDEARPLAERLSSRHRVLIYDRPLCGGSDVVVKGNSPFEMWTDTLHELLARLGMSPTYAGGGSLSINICLLLAFRHPGLVRGLLLIAPPTDDPQSWRWLADSGYSKSAEIAETQGMQAVLGTSFNWSADWPALIQRNPANRQRLLLMDPTEFASVMRRWGQSLVSGRAHCGGLTNEQLRTITSPALIVPGLDGLHPQHAAEELHRHLPNSELVVFAEHFSPDELRQLRQWAEAGEGWRFDAALAPVLEGFIQRLEAEQSSSR